MIDYKKLGDFIRSHKHFQNPDIALVLGSGLGFLADPFDKTSIDYDEIPDFPRPTVEGHSGKIVFGRFGNNTVMMFKGRFHFYEGYSLETISILPRVAKLCGASLYFATNAAGGINRDFKAGDLMIIEDHLNLIGTNPLIGRNNDGFGPRFPDMTFAYDRALSTLLDECGREKGLTFRRGVYAALTGPSYETPAEIKMLRTLGADTVGMSTVPEVIAARHAGMKCCGFSCVTNLAAGVTDNPLSHEEVLETTERVKGIMGDVVSLFLEKVSLNETK